MLVPSPLSPLYIVQDPSLENDATHSEWIFLPQLITGELYFLLFFFNKRKCLAFH